MPRPYDAARQRRLDRFTAGLAAVMVAAGGTVAAGQFGRMLQRRRHERDGGQGLIENAPVAALDTVGVAVEGYSAAPRSETVLFNLLAGFIGSFALVRLSTWGIRSQWWPFGNVRVGGRHIHHFVPGVLLAFGAGTAALLSESSDLDSRLAVPMGAGMGLTFDEAALLLELRDVYWTREGLLSVQVTFGLAALLSIAILTIRMLARGERRQEQAGVIPPDHGHHAPPPIPVG